MNLFTTNPSAWHWPLWALLLALLFGGAHIVIGMTREYLELRRFEEQRRLIPPRPAPKRAKDRLAGEYRIWGEP